MKKKFTLAKIEIIKTEENDIIATSGNSYFEEDILEEEGFDWFGGK